MTIRERQNQRERQNHVLLIIRGCRETLPFLTKRKMFWGGRPTHPFLTSQIVWILIKLIRFKLPKNWLSKVTTKVLKI